jgi:hypothetical protein
MKTYQIIIQSNEDIDGIDFQSQDGESAKVISIIDISSMYNKEVVEYIKDFNVSDDIGEA